MTALYVTEQNAWIRKTSDRLIVQKDDQIRLEIPCLKISQSGYSWGTLEGHRHLLGPLLRPAETLGELAQLFRLEDLSGGQRLVPPSSGDASKAI